MAGVEKEETVQRGFKPPESHLFLQWGNRKRLRCLRVKGPEISDQSNGGRIRRKITSGFVSVSDRESSLLQPAHISRNSLEATALGSASPEKENRYYTTRGSLGGSEENRKVSGDGGGGDEKRRVVLPKLFVTLSSKEKEEDFWAMKGCKLPQRPKKRAKIIQKSVLLVSPGAWLSDMCQERYEIREKKCSKKRPRGLRAMGSMGSDSE